MHYVKAFAAANALWYFTAAAPTSRISNGGEVIIMDMEEHSGHDYLENKNKGYRGKE